MERERESEVSDHDDVGDARLSRHGRREEDSEPQNEIARAHDEGRREEVHRDGAGQRTYEIDARAVDAFAAEVGEEVDRAIVSIAKLSSGPIPDADELDKYPPEIRDKIIEWHDREVRAVFDDESKRQDKLVDAEVNQGNTKQWLSFVVELLLIVGPLVAFYFIRDPSVFWAYTILGANVIGNVVINIGGKKIRRSRRNQEDEHEE